VTPTFPLEETEGTREGLPLYDFGERKKPSGVSSDLIILSLGVVELKFVGLGMRKEGSKVQVRGIHQEKNGEGSNISKRIRWRPCLENPVKKRTEI